MPATRFLLTPFLTAAFLLGTLPTVVSAQAKPDDKKPAAGDNKPGDKPADDKEPEDEGEGGDKDESALDGKFEEEKVNPKTPFFTMYAEQGGKLWNGYVTAYTKKAKAPPAQKAAASKAFDEAVAAAIQGFENMTRSIDPSKDLPSNANAARTILASLYLTKGDTFPAYVLASYASDNLPDTDKNALAAAQTAQNAMLKEFQERLQAKEEATFEKRKLMDAANRIVSRFPTVAAADQSRIILATLYRSSGQLEKSAEILSDVPETSAKYEEAQHTAGQNRWILHQNPERIADLPPEGDARKAKLNGLLRDAKTNLQASIKQQIADAGQNDGKLDAKATKRLLFNRYALAQIHNLQGNYEDAVAELTGDPLTAEPIVNGKSTVASKAYETPEWKTRVQQELLRSYVGLNNIEKAKESMANLEKISEGGDPRLLMTAYRSLGKSLESQLENTDDAEQKKKIRASFEVILDDIAGREGTPKLSDLLWVGTTYAAFADAAEDDEAKSEYTGKAVTVFERIISTSEADPKFLAPSGRTGIQLEIVDMRVRAGEFDEARDVLAKVLQSNPGSVSAQVAAAEFFQTEAESKEDPELYMKAIRGTALDGASVWGWEQIANRLFRLLTDDGRSTGSGSFFNWTELVNGARKKRTTLVTQQEDGSLSDLEKQHFNAWHSAVESRMAYAELLSGDAKKAAYQDALSQLYALSQTVTGIPPEWAKQFNELVTAAREKVGDTSDETIFPENELAPAGGTETASNS